MSNLLIRQYKDNQLEKTWKILPKNHLITLGRSQKADLRSVDPDDVGIKGAFEYQDNKWIYLNLDPCEKQFNENSEVVINQEFRLEHNGHTTIITSYDNREPLFSKGQNKSEYQDFQIFIIKQNSKQIELKLFPLKNEKQIKKYLAPYCVELKKNSAWSISPVFDIEIWQKSVSKFDLDNEKLILQDRLLNKQLKKSILLTSVMGSLFTVFYFLAPTNKNAGEVATQQQLPKEFREIKMEKPKKKLVEKKSPKADQHVRQVASVQNSLPSQPPSNTSKSNVIQNLKSSRFSQLLGKISSQSAKTKNVIISNGVSAASENSARALAVVNKIKSSTDWGEEGKGSKLAVNTISHAGGTSGFGKLSDGNVGKGGAELIEDESVVSGGLDRDIIAQYIKTQIGQILYCYERQLSANPDLFGKIAVKFTIGSKGEVVTQNIGDSTLKNATVEGCILQKVAKWKFPAPEGGTKVIVTYPFLFKSTN